MTELIFLDTETTGLCPKQGHRMVEIGAIKMCDGIICEDEKDIFHHYINPERNIGSEVVRIHGITNEKVKNSPKFFEIGQKFLDFIKDSALVIHNAPFDLKFLNFQLQLMGLPDISNEIIDTLVLAKKKYPGSPASLDALCKRFDISLKDRSFHGALLDSKLLACIYRKMISSEKNDCFLDSNNSPKNSKLEKENNKSPEIKKSEIYAQYFQLQKKIIHPTENEELENQKFLKKIFKS